MTIRFFAALVGLVAVMAACDSGKTAQNNTSDTARGGQATQPATGMQGMQGMGDTSGTGGMRGMAGMQGGDMMAQMQDHLRMMNGASGDSLETMLPAHRQMVGNMLGQMNQQMRSMNMNADPQWTALVDSLRQDLVRMPDMSPKELQDFIPAHRARITRLMGMHRSMMGSMKQ